jgi:hypothetical protein
MNRNRVHSPGPRAVPGSQHFARAATWESSQASVGNPPAASQGRLAVRSGSGAQIAVFGGPWSLSPSDGERAGERIRRTRTSRFEPQNRTERRRPRRLCACGYPKPALRFMGRETTKSGSGSIPLEIARNPDLHTRTHGRDARATTACEIIFIADVGGSCPTAGRCRPGQPFPCGHRGARTSRAQFRARTSRCRSLQ